jgi:hypothetical protein
VVSEWKSQLNADPTSWLLENDAKNPGVRYFALRDLLDMGQGETEVREAQEAVMSKGPVPVILDAQNPEGFWVQPLGGYSPKYQGTTWQILILAELGADPAEERVRRGCEYVLRHSVAKNGAFAAGQKPVPSNAIHCLNGNMIYALLRFGFGDDPRVQGAIDWIARAITGEGEFPYLKSGTTGPSFSCSVNLGQSCGWGANKALRALAAIPKNERSPLVDRAIAVGVEFLLSRDPAESNYPFTERVSSTWFKFGFPMSYWSDVLETTTVLVELGYGKDSRLNRAFKYILDKQDEHGRWLLENTLNRMWVEIEKKKEPSKWVTLRALRVLYQADVFLYGAFN